MNKQEYQQKIKNMKRPKFFNAITLDEAYEAGFEEAKNNALFESCFLDEPEKPVVPQFVADMIIKRKTAGQSVIKAIENLRFYEDACKWVRNNGETFVKAWLFGYEVEKEKLYTVKFANEDFGTIYIGIFKKANKIGLSTLPMNNEYSKCYFTESELKEFKFWDNPAFEVDEVKE